jgi:tetratricopeptide (TPR) repeat protein
MQIVESSFGESVRYVYSETSTRSLLTRSSSVDDFFQSASSGSLFGQRVVHNEVETAIRGYVAYVLIEVSKKDLKDAYVKFIEKKKAQKELVLAETRGAVLLETRHYRKALDYYRKMVRKDPKSDVWWIGVGAAFYRLGEYRAALDATDNGLLRNPLSFYGYWNRASILRRLGRPRAAIESLGEACRLRPSQACSRRLRKERLGVR